MEYKIATLDRNPNEKKEFYKNSEFSLKALENQELEMPAVCH